MKNNLSVSLFVPVYNEEKIIEGNIMKIEEKLKSITDNYELTIVDDTSKDKTAEICKKIAKKKIKYIRFDNGPSRRENLAVAMKKAKKEIIVYIDSDLATNLRHLEDLIKKIEHNDIVIGSRYSGIKAKREFSRKIMSILYNHFLKFYLGSKINDHQCGFKAFRKHVLLDLIKESGYDKDFVRGWFWDAEILIRAQKKRYNILEIPVEWKYGDKTSFSLKRELKVIPYILKIKQRLKS